MEEARAVRDGPGAVVLVVESDEAISQVLCTRLAREGFRVLHAYDTREVVELYEQGVDLVLLDQDLGDADGVELLRRLRALDPDPQLILLAPHGSSLDAAKAINAGAFHFARMPLDLDEITSVAQRALEEARLGRRMRAALARERREHGIGRVIGESAGMRRVKDLLEKVAESRVSRVLVTGESGVGKDMVARAIHAQSERASCPFINITCSALPEALLESELFGHERGAFTDARQQKLGLLEQAEGGTVFLDEIGEMSPLLQAKLLRFLEERAFRRVGGNVDIRPDVRVIAATHRDLATAVQTGGFREDLFYRLVVAHIDIPPLREREGDISLLTDHFVEHFARELGKRPRPVEPEARAALESYRWPGNVRELKNTLERAMLFCSTDSLSSEDLQLLSAVPASAGRFLLPPEGVELRSLELDLLLQALARAGGNQTKAAALLGLNRDQIRYRITKFGLDAAGHSKRD